MKQAKNIVPGSLLDPMRHCAICGGKFARFKCIRCGARRGDREEYAAFRAALRATGAE